MRNLFRNLLALRIRSQGIALVFILIMILLGEVGIFHGTENGPAGYSDSATYIIEARNIIRGKGPGYYYPDGSFQLNSIQPPLYSYIISCFGLIGIDLVVAARVINIVLFAATLFMIWIIFSRHSYMPSLSFLAVVSIGMFPVFFEAHLTAMTESLFIFLYLTALYFLLRSFTANTYHWLIASLITGFLPVTRYYGLAFIPAGMLGLLIFTQGNMKRRIGKAIAFCVIASLPSILWLSRIGFSVNQLVLGKDTAFDYSLLVAKFQDFRAGVFGIIWNWIPFIIYLPPIKSRFKLIILSMIIILAGALIYYSIRRKSIPGNTGNPGLKIFTISGLFGFFMGVFLLFTYMFFGLPGRWDDRQLIMIYISTSLGALDVYAFWGWAYFVKKYRWLNSLPWFIVLLTMIWYYPQVQVAIRQSHDGLGTLANRWRYSETISALRFIPRDIPIISNESTAIQLWGDRPAYELRADLLNPNFISQTGPYGTDRYDPAQLAFREQAGILIIFGRDLTQHLFDLYGEAGRIRAGTLFDELVVRERYLDSMVYTFPSK